LLASAVPPSIRHKQSKREEKPIKIMRRNARPLWEWEWHRGRWVVGVQWVASKGGSATTPQIAGIEHRQLVHKVFWPAYATINAVKALRRRRDMQKNQKIQDGTKIKLKLVHY